MTVKTSAMTGGTTITVKTSAMTGRMTMTAKVTTMTALWTRQTMAKLLMQMTVRMIKKNKNFYLPAPVLKNHFRILFI